MTGALKILIIVGLIVWGLLLFDQIGPMKIGDSLSWSDPNSPKCQKFARTIEGEQALSYKDRLNQFVNGCW